MAKPHKYAADGIDVETVLAVDTLANMAQRAAAESTGDMLRGKHRIVSVKSTDQTIEFRVNDFLLSFKKLMVFTLTVQPQGGRSFVRTTIDWYLTTQTTVGGFIPVTAKSMLAHHTYMQFVMNLAEQIRAADPAARITIREGLQPTAPTAPGGAASPPQPSTSGAVLPPAPPPSAIPAQPVAFAAPPPPPPGLASPAGSFAPPPPPPRSAAPLPVPPPPPAAVPAVPLTAGDSAASSIPAPPRPPAGGIVTGIPGMPSVSPPPPPTPPQAASPFAGLPPLVGLAPQAAALFADDDDLDSTRMVQSGASARPWTLMPASGRSIRVGGSIAFGRAPTAPADHADAHPIALDDPYKSVSKTHAVIVPRDGMLWVTDLHSTNGTTLTNTIGEATSCPPGVAMPLGEGWTLSLGEFSMTARLGE